MGHKNPPERLGERSRGEAETQAPRHLHISSFMANESVGSVFTPGAGVAQLARFKAPQRAGFKSAAGRLGFFLALHFQAGFANSQIISVLFCIMPLKLRSMAACPQDLNCARPAPFLFRPIPPLSWRSLASVAGLGESSSTENSGEEGEKSSQLSHSRVGPPEARL